MKDYNGILCISEPEDDFCVYKMCSSDPLDNSIYIGVTSNYKSRCYQHAKQRKYKSYINNPLYIWMNKLIDHKVDGKVLFVIIEKELSEKVAFEKERELIHYYKMSGYNVLNIADGGKGYTGMIPWNKGKIDVYNEEQLKRFSEAQKGRESSFKGKKHTEESKKLISQRNIERKNKGWINPKIKKVYKYTKDYILIATYTSADEVSKVENVSKTNVVKWCTNKHNPKNGYIYSYKLININNSLILRNNGK